MLSGLSAATSAASAGSNGVDLTSLLSTFGGAQAQDNKFGLDDVLGMFLQQQQAQQVQQEQKPQGLLSSLFGGSKPQQTQQVQPTDMLSALLSAQQQKPQTNSVLGTLLGGAQSQQQAQSTLDGTDLLNLLMALKK